jgi:tetratricopeptide (TPR) repeat protein
VFNQLLCEAFLAMGRLNHQEASKLLDKAQQLCPDKREVVFYKTSVSIALHLRPTTRTGLTKEERMEKLGLMIGEYDAALKNHKDDSFLHFYRGVLELYKHDFPAAFNDFEKAVTTTEEANGKYYVYRGLTSACMNMFKEALKDFSIAIKLNEGSFLAYYNRGKCAYLLGDTDMAFKDFQKLIMMNPVSTTLKNARRIRWCTSTRGIC